MTERHKVFPTHGWVFIVVGDPLLALGVDICMMQVPPLGEHYSPLNRHK